MGLVLLGFGGLLIGLLSWGAVPRIEPMGAAPTALLGASGAFIGAFLSCALTNCAVSEVHLAGAAGGVLGAIVLLSITVRALSRRAAV